MYDPENVKIMLLDEHFKYVWMSAEQSRISHAKPANPGEGNSHALRHWANSFRIRKWGFTN